MTDLKLSPRMADLYRLLLGKGDVPVVELYASMMPGMKPDVARRKGRERVHGTLYAQVWIGTYISRLNKRLATQGLRVEPGQIKRTYRLVSTR